jgi:bacterioferritin-associated ferredoxin
VCLVDSVVIIAMIICSCMNVKESSIRTLTAAGLSLNEIQRITRACEQCGTCKEDFMTIWSDEYDKTFDRFY